MSPSESMAIRAAMADALMLMCREDANDADAYVYAYDRLAQVIGIAPKTPYVVQANSVGDDVKNALESILKDGRNVNHVKRFADEPA